MKASRWFDATRKIVIFCLLATSPSIASEITSVPAALSQENALFRTFLSPSPDTHSIAYEVRKGDNLTAIAKKHHVTADLLKKTNGLVSDKIIPGDKLKISTYKMSLWIDKSDNMLILKGDQDVLKTYRISTGANNSTPVGVFKITDKLINPTWYKAGAVVAPESAKNELGTRWMGITAKGYGIHGTVEPEKLGQQITAGCVRMKNEEVEELYSLIPAGTEVTIQD
jgi:lipoprotein-anchoring transpeptidase ErfK/SrfK